MDKKFAKFLLKKTQADYNLIAEDFSRTRVFVPEELKNWILQYVLAGKSLDWGCGK